MALLPSIFLFLGLATGISFGFTLFLKHSKDPLQSTDMVDHKTHLRHVVLFKFKENTTAKQMQQVENAFASLPAKIPEIKAFEWGTNNSPEGLDRGFTHCFFLTFSNEKGRDTYLPHPDHKLFGDLASPYIEDVLVIDYWPR